MPLQQVEAVSEVEMTEACYDLLRAEHKRKPQARCLLRVTHFSQSHGICFQPLPASPKQRMFTPDMHVTLLLHALALITCAGHPDRTLGAGSVPRTRLAAAICALSSCRKYRTWLQHGFCGPEAFVLRAQIHKNAKCYLQATPQPLSQTCLLTAHSGPSAVHTTQMPSLKTHRCAKSSSVQTRMLVVILWLPSRKANLRREQLPALHACRPGRMPRQQLLS